MDSLETFRSIVRRVLTEFVEFAGVPHTCGEPRHLTVFDREHDRYLVVVTGWDRLRRVHNIAIQLDIIDAKIWIQCDNTDIVIARDLERAGVPKKDIVLGFQPPEVRPLTEYAVA